METPTAEQRRFMETLLDGEKEHRQIEPFFDLDNARVVAEIRETYQRDPPWVRVSVSIGGLSPKSHATFYELTPEGRAIATP